VMILVIASIPGALLIMRRSLGGGLDVQVAIIGLCGRAPRSRDGVHQY